MSLIRFGTALLDGALDAQQRATLNVVPVTLPDADASQTLTLRGYRIKLANAGSGRRAIVAYATDRTPTETNLYTSYRGVKLATAQYRAGSTFERYLSVRSDTGSATPAGEQTFRGVRLATNAAGALLAVVRDVTTAPDEVARVALGGDVLTLYRYGAYWHPVVYVIPDVLRSVVSTVVFTDSVRVVWDAPVSGGTPEPAAFLYGASLVPESAVVSSGGVLLSFDLGGEALAADTLSVVSPPGVTFVGGGVAKVPDLYDPLGGGGVGPQ